MDFFSVLFANPAAELMENPLTGIQSLQNKQKSVSIVILFNE
jgi:hypothetical protein